MLVDSVKVDKMSTSVGLVVILFFLALTKTSWLYIVPRYLCVVLYTADFHTFN